MKRKFALIACMLLALLWAGCSRDNDSTGDNGHYTNGIPVPIPSDGDPVAPRQRGDVTLRVAMFGTSTSVTHMDAQWVINQMARELRSEGIYLDLEIYELRGDFRGNIQDFDLIAFDPLPPNTYAAPYLWPSLARAGELANFFHFIDTDPSLTRDDFLTGIVEAFMYDGGLYVFPQFTRPRLVGINTYTMPDWAVERFMQYDVITMQELVTLYEDVVLADLGADRNLQFGLFPPEQLKWYMLSHGLNLYETDIHSFAQFLDDILPMLSRAQLYWEEWDNSDLPEPVIQGGAILTPTGLDVLGRVSAFSPLSMIPEQVLLGVSATAGSYPFDHFIPLATPDGEIIMSLHHSNSVSLAINPAGNTQLAWDFLIRLYERNFQRLIMGNRLAFPTIYRGDVAGPFSSVLVNFGRRINISDIQSRGQESPLVVDAVDRLMSWMEMPMHREETFGDIFFENEIGQLLEWHMPTSVAAEQILGNLATWRRYGW